MAGQELCGEKFKGVYVTYVGGKVGSTNYVSTKGDLEKAEGLINDRGIAG